MKIDERVKSLVRGLFEDKQCAKELDDQIKEQSTELKSWMSEHKVPDMMVDNVSVTYKPQVRTSMDEGKVLEILKALFMERFKAGKKEEAEKIRACIKTKEYVDEELLETLIYDEIVDKSLLEPAEISKTIYVLNLREKKGTK